VRQCQCSSTQLCIYIYIYMYICIHIYVCMYIHMCVSGEPLHRRRVGHSNRTRPRGGVTGSGLETTRTSNSLDNDLRYRCVVFVPTLGLRFVFGFILSFMCLFVVSFSGLKFLAFETIFRLRFLFLEIILGFKVLFFETLLNFRFLF